MSIEQQRDAKKVQEALEADKKLYENEAMRSKIKKESPEDEGVRLAKLTKELLEKQKEKKK
jgi:hypothetical protein